MITTLINLSSLSNSWPIFAHNFVLTTSAYVSTLLVFFIGFSTVVDILLTPPLLFSDDSKSILILLSILELTFSLNPTTPTHGGKIRTFIYFKIQFRPFFEIRSTVVSS